jgi:hypothetical protein
MRLQGAGREDVLGVLQVPGNKADAVPCNRIHSEDIYLSLPALDFPQIVSIISIDQ